MILQTPGCVAKGLAWQLVESSDVPRNDTSKSAGAYTDAKPAMEAAMACSAEWYRASERPRQEARRQARLFGVRAARRCIWRCCIAQEAQCKHGARARGGALGDARDDGRRERGRGAKILETAAAEDDATKRSHSEVTNRSSNVEKGSSEKS